MKYTLRQLEIFLATAHHQSISLAARDLAMSQSAASEALKTLEQQFDIQLFDRVGKNLRLNDLGKSLRAKSEALVDQAKALETAFRRHTDVGDLTIGATLSIGNYLAIPIMAKFMQMHKDAKITLDVANTSTITARVKNFELDIGLVEGHIADPELDVMYWRNDTLVAFCSCDHPAARHSALSAEDIERYPWILREPGSGTRQTFDIAMDRYLPRISVGLELQHTEAIKRAVEAKLGIGCLSEVTLIDAFKRGNLVPLTINDVDFSRQFSFVLHKQKFRSASINAWIELCKQD